VCSWHDRCRAAFPRAGMQHLTALPCGGNRKDRLNLAVPLMRAAYVGECFGVNGVLVPYQRNQRRAFGVFP
jgi:hypothetical protein